MSELYCPKCKKTVGEKDIRCPHCNMRLKVHCPSCGKANSFGTEQCSCGTILLKYCENCSSANFPNAKLCRKCFTSFDEKIYSFEKNRKKVLKNTDNENIQVLNANENIVNQSLQEKSGEDKSDNYVRETEYVSNPLDDTELVLEDVPLEFENTTDAEIKNTDNKKSVNKNQSEILPGLMQELSQGEVKLAAEAEQPEVLFNDIDYEDLKIEEAENIDSLDIRVNATVEDIPSELNGTNLPGNVTENTGQKINTEDIILSEESNTEISIEPEQDGQINYSPEARGDVEQEDDIVYFNRSEELLEQLTTVMQTENNAVVVAICGEEGIGKSAIIKTFMDNLAAQGIIPIFAEGSELIKVSPYGCIRDALLKLLTLPDFHPDIQSFYSEETKQLFIQNFETLKESEIINFMNFLYPSMNGNFEDIYAYEKNTVELLEKILLSITAKNKVVFIIDNFDVIDSSSFDFINKLITKGIINNEQKLFVSYKENKSAKLYFDKNLEYKEIFSTLYLNNLSNEETLNLVKGYANTPIIPSVVSEYILTKGRGNIFFTEQFLTLLFDSGYMYIDAEMMKFKEKEPLPITVNNIEEVIQQRFETIQSQNIKESLLAASILGYKFDKTIFASVIEITIEQAEELLKQLSELLYIQQSTEYEYSFKNLTTWSVIFDIAQNDGKFKTISKKLLLIFSQYALSNPTLKAIIAKYTENTNLIKEAWYNIAAICSYLGDIEMYGTALEELLINTGYDKQAASYSQEQLDIMEKIGKISYKIQPHQAIEYLTSPIEAAKEAGNTTKVIDLCGYLIKACYEVSDYNGVIEASDLLLATTDAEISILDKALIKSKKLLALFKSGNCEEGINLANNEVIPQLEEALSKDNQNGELMQSVLESWFDTSVNLINLYSLQGNVKALETADNVAEILKMNNIENSEYTLRLNLSKSFALTVTGHIYESAMLLKVTETIPEYKNTKYIVIRNIIYALNLILSDNTENLKEQLYDFAKFANDNNDIFGKHIFKMMFAWMIYNSENYERANVIFNDELTYFAKIKTVTGALISWLFIAKNTLALEGFDNAEHIALKALEVSQNPKFLQHHAAVYIQKLIAEINIIKGDVEAAKMYLEKSLHTAKQFGLELAQVEIYRTYTKFMEQLMLQEQNKTEYAIKADKIYKAAISISEKLKVYKLTAHIKKERQALLEYCIQNGIKTT